MKRQVFIVLLFFLILPIFSQEEYKFRIQLKDKGETGFSLDHPEEFLSQRSIERRKNQKITITESDLPISSDYIQTIENLGCTLVAKSKWIKTISIHCADSSIITKIRALDFVEKADCVWIGDYTAPTLKRTQEQKITASPFSEISPNYYGYCWNQMKTVNGQILHEKGYEGEGIQIAVIDGGFFGLDTNPLSDNMNILGEKNFVYQQQDKMQHGFEVLSLMASNTPNQYVGTAPKAGYWLLRTEDSERESPIEEDYWITAIEYADSIGVDLVNSSLGYFRFDSPFKSHSWDELDGKTTLISQAAEMATQKGIFVVNSAGNERMFNWKKIAFPADAEHVLAVGSITNDSVPSSFSSIGPAVGGRIKPDIAALGDDINFILDDGTTYKSRGTSYSSPIMCGLVACLWEAFPHLTNYKLLDIIRKASHQYTTPDEYWGYGIPDMKKAFELAEGGTSGIEPEIEQKQYFKIYSLGDGHIRIENQYDSGSYHFTVFTLNGKAIFRGKLTQTEQDFFIPKMNEAIILNLKGNGINHSVKVRL